MENKIPNYSRAHNISNRTFFETHAKKGNIGLVGGSAFIDVSIRQMQKKVTMDNNPSFWSHAFIVTGKREDDCIWMVESDLEFHKKQIKLGVQEARIDKYFDEETYPNVALLDFNLDESQSKMLVAEALNLVALRTEYSIREVFGVLYSIVAQKSRLSENKLAQENALFCSAMVQKCFSAIHFNLNTAINTKQLTPQDIYATNLNFKGVEVVRAQSLF
jgi:hypothetical protein